jgi:hypothetical protein
MKVFFPMQPRRQKNDVSVQKLPVYQCTSFTVTDGANLGDFLSFADELMLDDIYQLCPDTEPQALTFAPTTEGCFRITADSALGRPNAALHLDSCITVMPPTGETVEALVLVEVDDEGNVVDIYLQPMSPLVAKTPYSLVGIDRDSAPSRLAQMACVSFSRGTHITTISGEQVPIERLAVDDLILTRDDGPQKIRWIGKSTHRALGEFAPIVITANTLNNANDLIVSPDHRLFIYQREDHIGAGRNELLVKARHLVNGDTVYVQEGGFVDYYQLLFDTHQIIFAEGISAETMVADNRTNPMLPKEMQSKLRTPLPGTQDRAHMAIEVHEHLLRRPDAVDLLRRASSK